MFLWDLQTITSAINNGNIEWHRHAFERMMERGISRREVMDVLLTGEVIEEYPTDYPHPSVLMLGNSGEIPLHVVAAFDYAQGTLYIITAYYPDFLHFLDDYKTRRT
ncbi:MAG: DUF4258 domain-containing protein [Steroidobacteraceae bacterium]|nr:DUF4258 domain-containing protein [Deltaproteobacteria bacterium]